MRLTPPILCCVLIASCSISSESTSSGPSASTAQAVTSTIAATVAASVPATTLIAPTTLQPTTTTTTSPPVVAVDQLVSPQAIAKALEEAGLGCADLEVKGDTGSSGSPPELATGNCTLLGGIRINVLVMADRRVAALSERILAGLSKQMKKAGVQELAFVEAGPDGMVWVNLETTTKHLTPRPTDAERATLELLASALQGRVRSVTA